jgi:hypothetical protein
MDISLARTFLAVVKTGKHAKMFIAAQAKVSVISGFGYSLT